jgi:hypothetical protein
VTRKTRELDHERLLVTVYDLGSLSEHHVEHIFVLSMEQMDRSVEQPKAFFGVQERSLIEQIVY